MQNEDAPIVTVKEIRGYREPKMDYSIIISTKQFKELQELYEKNFLDRYYDDVEEAYLYSEGDLVSEICERFKSWIDDNFDLDELLEDEEGDDDED